MFGEKLGHGRFGLGAGVTDRLLRSGSDARRVIGERVPAFGLRLRNRLRGFGRPHGRSIQRYIALPRATESSGDVCARLLASPTERLRDLRKFPIGPAGHLVEHASFGLETTFRAVENALRIERVAFFPDFRSTGFEGGFAGFLEFGHGWIGLEIENAGNLVYLPGAVLALFVPDDHPANAFGFGEGVIDRLGNDVGDFLEQTGEFGLGSFVEGVYDRTVKLLPGRVSRSALHHDEERVRFLNDVFSGIHKVFWKICLFISTFFGPCVKFLNPQ